MANVIAKYKLKADGTVPEWIINGGYFMNGYEMLGLTCDTEQHWVPSDLQQQTREEIKTWAKAISIRNAADDGFLNDAETEALVDSWLTSLGLDSY